MSDAAQFSREMAERVIAGQRAAQEKIANERRAEIERHQAEAYARNQLEAQRISNERWAATKAAAEAQAERDDNIKAGDEYAAMLREARHIEARAMSSAPSPAAFVFGFLSAAALVVAIVWRLFL